jgi:hypothetical protein
MESTGIELAELDLELGEYLPAREVMWCGYSRPSSTHQSNTAVVGSGDGNTSQFGLINVSALNGNFDGNLNSIRQGNFA